MRLIINQLSVIKLFYYIILKLEVEQKIERVLSLDVITHTFYRNMPHHLRLNLTQYFLRSKKKKTPRPREKEEKHLTLRRTYE